MFSWNYIVCLLMILALSNFTHAQYSNEEQHQIDSLSFAIANSKGDLEKIQAYTNLCGVLHIKNLDTVIDLANQIILISKKNLEKELSKEDEFLFKKHLASAISDIGYVYDDYGRIKEASEKYYTALKIQEQIGDKDGISSSLNNLGMMYEAQGKSKKALEFYLKSVKISQELNDSIGLSVNYGNIGAIYRENRELDLALKYFLKSLSLRDTLDKYELANTFSNIGLTYAELELFEKSYKYLSGGLEMRKKIGDEEGVALSYLNLSDYYYVKNDMQKAKESAEKGYDLCKDLGMPEDIQISAKILSEIHRNLKNYKEGWEFYEIYIEARDKLRNDENITALIEQNSQFEFDKKQAVSEAEHKKNLEIAAEKEKNQKLITFAVVLILFMAFFFLFVIFRRLKITREQKEIIAFQKEEIVDSITYAKRIQEAILTTNQVINDCLPENFIYYKPKDIIGGDFYWIEEVKSDDLKVMNDEEENTTLTLFAAADCTGHGVPGAMVSVVCNNALNRSIKEYRLIDPGKILDKTREIVVEQFNKSTTVSVNNIKDGMDIALCSLNKKTNELLYAGAYNPLWIIRNKSSIVEEIKASRQAIGKTDNPQPFKTHKIQLNKGDCLYLFSDGFADQFGGKNDKKFKSKAFKKLLVSVQTEKMENQMEIINEAFETWKGSTEQVDDVCVIGVRI